MKQLITTQTKKLAKHTMLSLNIPNDNNLVLIFGTGNEANNMEAIANWIQNLNINNDLYSKDQILNELKAAAKEQIENAMDYN